MDAFLWSVTLLFVTVCTAVFECSEIKTLFRQCQVTHECARSTTSENPTPVFHSCCDVRGQGHCSHNDNDYVFSFSKISLIRNTRFQLGDKIWSQATRTYSVQDTVVNGHSVTGDLNSLWMLNWKILSVGKTAKCYHCSVCDLL